MVRHTAGWGERERERESEREREGERETGPLRGRNVNTRPQTKQSRRDASNLAPRPRRYT